jgi:voltage-gated potassium channel
VSATIPTSAAWVLTVAGLLGSGTIFYILAEGWSFVDAFYFATIILTTVGLGNAAPDTDLAKLFTVAYALIGIGVLVAFGTAFAQRLVAQAEAERKAGQSQ